MLCSQCLCLKSTEGVTQSKPGSSIFMIGACKLLTAGTCTTNRAVSHRMWLGCHADPCKSPTATCDFLRVQSGLHVRAASSVGSSRFYSHHSCQAISCKYPQFAEQTLPDGTVWEAPIGRSDAGPAPCRFIHPRSSNLIGVRRRPRFNLTGRHVHQQNQERVHHPTVSDFTFLFQ